MHSVFVHAISKNKPLENSSLQLPTIPVVGDTIALAQNGPWFVITKRIIIAFKSDFEAEIWAKEEDSIELTDL